VVRAMRASTRTAQTANDVRRCGSARRAGAGGAPERAGGAAGLAQSASRPARSARPFAPCASSGRGRISTNDGNARWAKHVALVDEPRQRVAAA
jgi:hypothetical protein